MRRLNALLALLLPVLSDAATLRVVPSLTAPVCGGACALGGSLGSRLDLGAGGTLSLTASLSPTPLTAPAPGLAMPLLAPGAALAAPLEPSTEPRLVVPGRAEGAPKKLVVAQTGDVRSALAAAEAAERAESIEGSAAAPDESMRALFDGAKPADAEAPFAPLMLSPDAGSGEPAYRRGLAEETSRLRREVDAALPGLRRSVALGGWNGPETTLDGSCCGDAAPKLAAYLRLRGFPAMLVESEFHYYVVVRLPGGDVVVDPTFRQFFGGKKASPAVPQAFVGRWADLHLAFERYRPYKSTSYGVERIYLREAKGREDSLTAAADAYADPARAEEHAGLRAALRGPSTERPRPSLIVP